MNTLVGRWFSEQHVALWVLKRTAKFIVGNFFWQFFDFFAKFWQPLTTFGNCYQLLPLFATFAHFCQLLSTFANFCHVFPLTSVLDVLIECKWIEFAFAQNVSNLAPHRAICEKLISYQKKRYLDLLNIQESRPMPYPWKLHFKLRWFLLCI